MSAKFELIAKTFQGLEEVLAKELVKLGAEKIEVLRRGVSFWGDLEMMYKANLCLRTAVRIIKPVFSFSASNADEVYERVKNFEWEQYLDNSKTFAIDAVVYSEAFRHSQYLSYKVKDAIVDRFRERTGARPSVRLTNPDLRINVHVSNTEVTISLDSSGEPLFKRGYRTGQTDAPMNEVLAAGILLLAGWDGQKDLIDPMCGSGTFLVEAALIAKNIAPGIYRKEFAFEKWADFDADLLQKLYDDDSNDREFTHKIYGSDILKQAIAITDDNVKHAGVSDCIVTKVSPFEDLEVPSTDAMVVTNPPYDRRLRIEEGTNLYEKFGTKLKNEFTGMTAWIISEPNEASKGIGLAPSKRIALDNGGIATELRKYDLFAGKREDFLREKAANAEEKEETPEELGYTFRKYEYPDPSERSNEDEEDDRAPRRGGFGGDRRGADRSEGDRGPRRSERRENAEEDEYTFDTPEERERYMLIKRRHESFERKRKFDANRENRPPRRDDENGQGREDRRERRPRGEREDRPRRSDFSRSGNAGNGYPNDRRNGGFSHERHTGQSWRRDGYRPREERGGTRGSAGRHDFRKDDYKPTRKFDRRNRDDKGE